MASKKNNGKAKRKKRLLILGLSSLIIIGAVTFTVGHYWIEIYDKYQEKKELEAKLVSLKEEEDELQLEADKLQDPDYIARSAREKYLYSKEGEFVIKIPEE